MKRFAQLFESIDATNSTLAKVSAIAAYFADAPSSDAAWALHILSGGKLKRVVGSAKLRAWACQASGLPEWLFHACYTTVGDLAETISLLLDRDDESHAVTVAPAVPPSGSHTKNVQLHVWIEERLAHLRELDERAQRESIVAWLRALPRTERFLLLKLLTGSLRVGVSRALAIRGLSVCYGIPVATLTHRLVGDWKPSAAAFESILSPDSETDDLSRPYPFYLASPIEQRISAHASVDALGPLREWQVEWKWDGIRAQLISRGQRVFLWSRGDELLTDRFPELAELGARLPGGTVLDGEVLCWQGGDSGKPLPFATLQRRIGRTFLSHRILTEAPVAFLAYDVIEHEGTDIRMMPLNERRRILESIVSTLGHRKLHLSPALQPDDWTHARSLRAESRARGVEGLMLKRLDSPYQQGRVIGGWWKWKVDPYTVDAVLVYAEPGHGRRANLLTDYTFAVWDENSLVPIAKAYSGLSNEEIVELDRWIRQHSSARHGPVRVVEPIQVFELAFEGIARSDRHRAGIALRFPRIHRWRTDKPAAEADTIETLRQMLTPLPREREPTLFD